MISQNDKKKNSSFEIWLLCTLLPFLSKFSFSFVLLYLPCSIGILLKVGFYLAWELPFIHFENSGLRWLVLHLILQWSPPPHIQMMRVKALLASASRLASQWVFWYFGALWFLEPLEAALPSFSPRPTHGANVYICNCWFPSLPYSYFWFLYTPSFVAAVAGGCLDLFF